MQSMPPARGCKGNFFGITVLVCCGISLAPGLSAADLAEYRGFRLGMKLQAYANLAKVDASQAIVLHREPALLEQMTWYPELTSESSQPDPVRSGIFSFCNGSLYRVSISYDDSKTEGLTAEDLSNSLSSYGTPTHPGTAISMVFEGVKENASVLAQWEDSDSLIRLVRISYRGRIALLFTAKRVDALAEQAMVKAKEIEAQEAPARDAARQKQEADDVRSALVKARAVNKPNFRP
jgi:hypothetical protein